MNPIYSCYEPHLPLSWTLFTPFITLFTLVMNPIYPCYEPHLSLLRLYLPLLWSLFTPVMIVFTLVMNSIYPCYEFFLPLLWTLFTPVKSTVLQFTPPCCVPSPGPVMHSIGVWLIVPQIIQEHGELKLLLKLAKLFNTSVQINSSKKSIMKNCKNLIRNLMFQCRVNINLQCHFCNRTNLYNSAFVK